MKPEQATNLRKPFPPESVGKLPKGGVMLDYVGHAAVTDRLLTVDPQWSWEPMALDQFGSPMCDRDGNLWIRLTICGVTRLGVGDGKNMKERVGDAIRNAAMRFGVALDLWAKENLVEFAQQRVDVVAHLQAGAGNQPPADEPDEPLPPAAESPLLNTSSKLARAMYAAINEAGVEEADRLPWLSNVIGHNVTSSKEMTEAEARAVLKFLDSQKKAAS